LTGNLEKLDRDIDKELAELWYKLGKEINPWRKLTLRKRIAKLKIIQEKALIHRYKRDIAKEIGEIKKRKQKRR